MKGNRFQRELDQLEALLNRLNNKGNKSMKGGAVSNDDSGSRHFKLLSVNGKFVDYTTRYDLPNVTKSGKPQRSNTPQAASLMICLMQMFSNS